MLYFFDSITFYRLGQKYFVFVDYLNTIKNPSEIHWPLEYDLISKRQQHKSFIRYASLQTVILKALKVFTLHYIHLWSKCLAVYEVRYLRPTFRRSEMREGRLTLPLTFDSYGMKSLWFKMISSMASKLQVLKKLDCTLTK